MVVSHVVNQVKMILAKHAITVWHWARIDKEKAVIFAVLQSSHRVEITHLCVREVEVFARLEVAQHFAAQQFLLLGAQRIDLACDENRAKQ